MAPDETRTPITVECGNGDERDSLASFHHLVRHPQRRPKSEPLVVVRRRDHGRRCPSVYTAATPRSTSARRIAVELSTLAAPSPAPRPAQNGEAREDRLQTQALVALEPGMMLGLGSAATAQALAGAFVGGFRPASASSACGSSIPQKCFTT